MAISQQRYSTVAIVLHWLIAALIVTNIGIAWYFNTLHGPAIFGPITLHKSIGITVLLLSLARLGWRLTSAPPPLPAYVAGWERWAAKATHVGFYVIMLGLPLTGWAMSSVGAKAFPIVLFHLVPWPLIGPLTHVPMDQAKSVHESFEAAHGLLAKLAYVLIVLHVGAALKHQFIGRDDVAARMIPFLKLRKDASS